MSAASGPPVAYTFALAGQPNVGKSTVFNALTGADQHVGNWPGKTVEKTTGHFSWQGRRCEIVDLPGTYSLASGSEEERIARDYLLLDPPDALIVLVNAASLERNLYLVAELLALGVPLVVGINMVDVAEVHGVRVEVPVLQAALGLPVVRLVATKGEGIKELIDAAVEVADGREEYSPNRPVVREKHRPVLEKVERLLAGHVPTGYPRDWVAVKLLEGDEDVTHLVKTAAGDAWDPIHEVLAGHDDAYVDIAGGRYDWIARMVRAAVVRPRRGVTVITDRIDRVATHPFWGLLVLLAALGAVFGVTYAAAGPASSALSSWISGGLSDVLRGWLDGAPGWLSGLLVDGVVAGAGTALSFIPILAVFFVALGLLEDVGYMARTAYVMDRYMHWMGLHGKSCMPLLLGFGCNVPAVMGARIIEDRKARLLTILLTPFVPCAGRLAVLAFLAPAFFGGSAAWVMICLVGGNLVLLALTGMAANLLLFKGQRSAFIMEMPLYHKPNAATVWRYVWRNTWAFVKKAGTLIVVVSAVVWALSTYPGPGPENSVLGMVGRLFEPLGALMGLGDWRLLVALASGFVAKENTVASLGVLFGVGAVAASGTDLAGRVASVLTPAGAAAFLVVLMTFLPCVATLAVIRHESRSWAWTAASLSLMLAIAFVLGVVVYQIGSHL